MTKLYQRKPSPLAASRNARGNQHLSDTDLADLVGGVEQGGLQLTGSVLPGVAITLEFSPGRMQLRVGASEADTLPWTTLEPAVKKLDSAG